MTRHRNRSALRHRDRSALRHRDRSALRHRDRSALRHFPDTEIDLPSYTEIYMPSDTEIDLPSDTEIDLHSDTSPLCITKETVVSMASCIFTVSFQCQGHFLSPPRMVLYIVGNKKKIQLICCCFCKIYV